MIETIKEEWQAKIAILLFLLLTAWWFISPHVSENRFFGDFPSIYFVMALWGGFWGVSISRKWGFFQSLMGKAILMFSLGLFAQSFGQLVYAYYAFYQHIAVPYPSLGDIGYFGTIPLYILGISFLAKASGVRISRGNLSHNLQAILLPLGMLIISYFIFLRTYSFDFSNPMKIFLDFGYPLGQSIYISLAVLTFLLSRGVLGGIMKSKVIFILIAFASQYTADWTFLFQSANGVWKAGGINDYMYLITYLLMTLGLIQLKVVAQRLST